MDLPFIRSKASSWWRLAVSTEQPHMDYCKTNPSLLQSGCHTDHRCPPFLFLRCICAWLEFGYPCPISSMLGSACQDFMDSSSTSGSQHMGMSWGSWACRLGTLAEPRGWQYEMLKGMSTGTFLCGGIIGTVRVAGIYRSAIPSRL